MRPGFTMAAPKRGGPYFWGFTLVLLRFSFTLVSAGMAGSVEAGVAVEAGSVVVVLDSVVVVEAGAGVAEGLVAGYVAGAGAGAGVVVDSLLVVVVLLCALAEKPAVANSNRAGRMICLFIANGCW